MLKILESFFTFDIIMTSEQPNRIIIVQFQKQPFRDIS